MSVIITAITGSILLSVAAAEPVARAPDADTDPTVVDPQPPIDVPEQSGPSLPEPPPPEPEVDPSMEALEHLGRAQALEAEGDLDSAEAEASVAIALDPQDPAAYLERAQIRIAMADEAGEAEEADRRARAALLRVAADDLGAYLERSELPTESRVWFETRRQSLLRSADALDPPEPEPGPGPPETEPPTTDPTFVPEGTKRRRDRDRSPDPRWKTGALLGTGLTAGAAGVVFSAMSLQIERRCTDLCGVRWGLHPAAIGTAATLAAVGSTTLAIGIAGAPAMARKRARVATGATTAALSTVAIVLGSVTAGLAGSRWNAPLSPSDDAGLLWTQRLANTSVASFTAALPLLSASLGAWLSPQRHREADTGQPGMTVKLSRALARRR